MLPKILIMIGSVLIGGGFIGLISIYLHPIMKAIRIFYKQDKEDFLYEHGRGQKAQEESRKTLDNLYKLSIVFGIVALASGLAIQYMPHGNDSIFSATAEGTSIGDDNEQSSITNEYSSNTTTDFSTDYTIVISGDVISLNNNTFYTIEEFKNHLETLERTKKVFLIDDFAISSVYHDVEKAINDCGFDNGDDTQ